MTRRFLLAIFILVALFSMAQHKPGHEYHGRRAVDAIVLNGELTELTWSKANVGSGFFMNNPYDSVPPTHDTHFRVAFDDQFLYLAFECMGDNSNVVVQSLRRDFEFRLSDNVGIYFDPYNDFTNGFFFNISLYGVQREGVMGGGGLFPDDFSSFWDNKWYSAVKRYDDRWTAELAIPLKSIRYNLDTWNFNILRNDAYRNQISSWIATPFQYLPASLAFSGRLIWDDPLPKPGLNVSVIPYVAGSAITDNEKNSSTNSLTAGFDAKVGVTPSLNLDLTFNPDFSQVEVDRQVINLTRFEFQFPELRQFFLENSDLFAQPGFPDSRPFFSRRLGLARDTSDVLVKVPILYGARLSGKLGRDWRIGAMNLQTRESDELGLPDQNYTVAVVQRQVSRSNIGFLFVNKQSLGLGTYDPNRSYHASVLHEVHTETDTVTVLNEYNRVIGADLNLFSKDARWRGKLYYHHSFDEFSDKKNFTHGAFLGYFTRHVEAMSAYMTIGENYNAEVGFVPGLSVYPGYTGGFGKVNIRMYPPSTKIAVMGPGIESNLVKLPTGTTTDWNVLVEYGIQFVNTSAIRAGVDNVYQLLTKDFNPIGSEYDSYAKGEEFFWSRALIEYMSDQRKVFNYTLRSGFGGFYDGTNFNIAGQLNYRVQPYGSLSVMFDYNDVELPDDHGDQRLFLVGSRLDVTFTDKIFLTTFVQVNNANDNVNLNARFQWRYKPASDFFVVYTENYLPQHLTSKNRALVFKLTYWLNL